MRTLTLMALFVIRLAANAQNFEKLKLVGEEIPKDYKVSTEMLCKSIQADLFYKNPELYKSILGSVKSKDFQSFESKGDSGSVLYFEYDHKIENTVFIEGLLWGGNRPSKEHPEEYFVNNNILVIWSFDKKSALKKISMEKIKGLFKDF